MSAVRVCDHCGKQATPDQATGSWWRLIPYSRFSLDSLRQEDDRPSHDFCSYACASQFTGISSDLANIKGAS